MCFDAQAEKDAAMLAELHRRQRARAMSPGLEARYHLYLAKAECTAMGSAFGHVCQLQRDVTHSLRALEISLRVMGDEVTPRVQCRRCGRIFTYPGFSTDICGNCADDLRQAQDEEA